MAATEKSPDHDDVDDLAGVDLASLDLDDIDLEERPSEAWRWVALALMLAVGALVLWVPATEWFRALGGGDGAPFFVLAAVGIVDGILLGRWLWRWAQDAAAKSAAVVPRAEPVGPPSALRRWATLVAIVAGGAAILYVPASAYFEGESYESTWFVAAAGAVVVGILIGRWLLMQSAARAAGEPERARLVLPPWFKWVTLARIAGPGVVVLAAKILGGSEPGAFEFSLGAAGFVAGVGGAIWLARRFDEWERRGGGARARGGRGDLEGRSRPGTPDGRSRHGD